VYHEAGGEAVVFTARMSLMCHDIASRGRPAHAATSRVGRCGRTICTGVAGAGQSANTSNSSPRATPTLQLIVAPLEAPGGQVFWIKQIA